MYLEKYYIKSDLNSLVFEFESYGPKGKIVKIIQYSPTRIKNFYNLGFGDRDPKTGKINDKVTTNNGDTNKVLATVASTVYTFTSRYPNAWVLARGNSQTKNRLYRIGLSSYLEKIRIDFRIFGLNNGQWQDFKKDVVYDAYLVKRKL